MVIKINPAKQTSIIVSSHQVTHLNRKIGYDKFIKNIQILDIASLKLNK